ncbi:hypothetical protein H5410_014396 [Solanum commersonii]|uniref:Uncharacterized protein n=1 Tax=Solanum commersonii TaxID=4109 RepID=A0A9J5ZRA1_SOLCO|nr:hypothetical protein H5410_014396 [Solanum commersonii]
MFLMQKYRAQKQQAPNVQPATSMNINREYHFDKYRSQTQQAPNVQPASSMNFNREYHLDVLNSSGLSTNSNKLFQGEYIPQPPKFSFIASPSSNDYSLTNEMIRMNC